MHAKDVLYYGHMEVLRAVEGLPEEAWERPGAVGFFSVKDVVAHLASFEALLVEILRSLAPEVARPAAAPPPLTARFARDPEAFNIGEVFRRRAWTHEQVLAEYRQNHETARRLLEELPPDVLQRSGALAWYGPNYDLEDFLAYTYYGHKREHAAHIGLYKDRLAEKPAGLEMAVPQNAAA